ncbi:MAG: aromatic ring-hydroxylating dioxygenase subunit alpha [Myxococcales bacterium]|nr:aromatic ring-hydroxylating dioxygenase subunit alpha [Myxococcales bacterium]MCB9718458.1 aromatic ring-hydroxylating dioxygenase subunit alpha [Myxococcales bacterium]
MRVPIDCWYVVLEGRELRRGRPRVARRLGLDLVFWRDSSGAPRAVLDRCPHRGASLGHGKVRDGQIECPFHGFRFDGGGACVKVPCNGPDAQRPKHLATRAFVLREEHGLVWLWWGEPREEYPPVPWFSELEGREHSGFVVDNDVSWMRNVENQLDWPHLPFVHGRTIGMGFDPRIEVRSVVEGDRLVTWLTRDEDEQGKPSFHIQLAFPHLWLNPLGGDRMMAMAAFVPVDETHTRMYFRTYARPLLVPGLARLVTAAVDVVNRLILGQDLRVVATQPPEPTVDVQGERLVQADLPIAQFRKEIARRSAPDPGLVTLRRHG